MTTAADVIAALNQRRLLKLGAPDAAGQMPAGWQRWFDAMPQADAGEARARIEAWVQPLARGLNYAAQPKATRLGLPFFHLQRLLRPFDPRDERTLRIGVGAVDIVLHVLLAALLLWLMYLRFMEMAKQGDEEASVVQVEFIGRGNAETGGGALANAGAQSAPASASPARTPAPTPTPDPQAARTSTPADARPAIEQVAMPTPPAVNAAPEAPPIERAPPPLARQVLQVSEVPQPQPEGFKLPPPRERSPVLPQVQLREVQPQQQVEAITTLEARPVQALQPAQRQAQLRAPTLKEQVREIEVFTPDASALTRERPMPAASDRQAQAQVQVPQLRGEVREIPLKAGGGTPSAQPGNGAAANGVAQAAGTGAAKAGATGAGQAQAGAGQGTRAAQNGGRGVTAAGSGAGPGLKPAPGGWPGAAKSDDWGASKRNVAGTGNGTGRDGDGKSGLFNADGSPRLPDEWSKESGLDLDRAGTWLKRPGLEYKATRFDKYWIPQGTLLQEWVRRGIKQLSIPIPGTGMKLQCVVSLLQLGGGCLPVDPDVNEQSSTGRAAPDVPFKPELQEDNGSVRPPEPATPPGG